MKPVLTISDKTSEVGKPVTFTCSAPGDESKGTVVYKLYKGSDQESKASKEMANGGIYNMTGSSTDDTGSYSCTATVGSGSESPKSDGITLKVVGKPQASPLYFHV